MTKPHAFRMARTGPGLATIAATLAIVCAPLLSPLPTRADDGRGPAAARRQPRPPTGPAPTRADDGREPAAPPTATPEPTTARPWTVTRRTISQLQAEGQRWRIDYQIRNDGPEAQVLTADAVLAEVDGWVSNSRVADHATPCRSSLVIQGIWGNSSSTLIDSDDESRRCRERATLHLWPAAEDAQTPEPSSPTWLSLISPIGVMPLVVPPGGEFRLRLSLEHDHFLYGPYEPLLGPRTLVLHLGAAVLRDTWPLDRELQPDRSVPDWPQFEPPADRLDSEIFLSAPESLHLAAHESGGSLYRLTGPVRYATRMRLSFWYLVAPGTLGDVKARVTQHKQGPSIWRSLHNGDQDHYLTTIGRWTHVERIFRTEPEATVLTAEFKLVGDVGEVWIDDVVLEPIGLGPAGP